MGLVAGEEEVHLRDGGIELLHEGCVLPLPGLEKGLDEMARLVVASTLTGGLKGQEEEEQAHEEVKPRAREVGAPSRTECRLWTRTRKG
jgi:hypothetical protein